jgi:putative tricarboxylic transport membrane protein
MLIHNLNPGPNLMLQTPEFFYQIVAMLLIADMSKLFYGLTLVRPLLWILLVPRERLMPIVFVLCVVGSYAITSRVFDIYVALFFGLLGFFLRELKFPMAPLILGLVLGDLLEKNMTRGLVLSDGSILPFFTRPVSAVLAAITIFSILWSIPGFHRWFVGLFRRRNVDGPS